MLFKYTKPRVSGRDPSVEERALRRWNLSVHVVVLAVALVCAAGLVGCKSQAAPASSGANSSLVGLWELSMGSASGPTWEFSADGKVKETLPKMSGGSQVVQGTYTVTPDNTVKVVTTGVKGGTEIDMKLEWVSPDSFKATMGGGTLTFTRKR